MSISEYQKTVVLLSEASRLHERASINLDQAKVMYAGKPYSSEAYFDLVIANATHDKAKFYLELIQTESQELKDRLIFEIREQTGIPNQTSPDPLSNRAFSELVDVLVILFLNTIRPASLTKLVNLLIGGDLENITELVDDTATIIRDIMRDALDDPSFGTGKTLSQLWNDPQNYVYNREGAAQCAIARSRRNFAEKDSNGDYVFPSDSTPPPNNVGGQFNYDTLTHLPGTTGSAYYISEMLFFGGNLVMRNCDENDINCDRSILLDLTDRWLTRETSGTNLGATSTWRDHDTLMSYFVNNFYVNERTNNPQESFDTIFYDNLSEYIDFTGEGIWKPETEAVGKSFLYHRFEEGDLVNLQTGDYLFFDLGTNPNHGFLIVGWGDAVDSPQGINTNIGRNGFTFEREPNKIPYVADFAYGKPDGQTEYGWKQDVRARPFYSVLAEINSIQLGAVIEDLRDSEFNFNLADVNAYLERLQYNQWGIFPYNVANRPNFQFFRFPDFLTIKTVNLQSPPPYDQGATIC